MNLFYLKETEMYWDKCISGLVLRRSKFKILLLWNRITSWINSVFLGCKILFSDKKKKHWLTNLLPNKCQDYKKKKNIKNKAHYSLSSVVMELWNTFFFKWKKHDVQQVTFKQFQASFNILKKSFSFFLETVFSRTTTHSV